MLGKTDAMAVRPGEKHCWSLLCLGAEWLEDWQCCWATSCSYTVNRTASSFVDLVQGMCMYRSRNLEIPLKTT